jgi:hypothetical protein
MPDAITVAQAAAMLLTRPRCMQKEAEEPNMEFTAMEAICGALTSGAAFCTGTSSACAWDSWLQALLTSRFVGAATDLSKLWAHTLARVLRTLANQVAGLTRTTLGGEEGARDVAEGLNRVGGYICSLVDGWTGSNTGDARYTHLLMYSIDHMMQVRCESPV